MLHLQLFQHLKCVVWLYLPKLSSEYPFLSSPLNSRHQHLGAGISCRCNIRKNWRYELSRKTLISSSSFGINKGTSSNNGQVGISMQNAKNLIILEQ